ncbi:hypothetical protein ACIQLJ_14535 [Microbacterium sp. NPDC091313]
MTPTTGAADAPIDIDSSAPSTWIIDSGGMGPLRLGMSLSAAREAVPETDECHGISFFWQQGTNALVYFQQNDAVRHIESWLPDGPRTASGIGVGSSRYEVLSAYPDAAAADTPSSLSWLRSGKLLFGFPFQYADDPDPLPDVVQSIAVTDLGPFPEFCG